MATVKEKTGRKGDPNVGVRARARAEKVQFVEELLKAHGCATVEELNAKLAATGEDTPKSMPAPDGPRFEGRRIVTGGKDALAFIDKDCPYVPFVSSTAIFVLRPGKAKFNPPIERVMLKTKGAKPWYSCPFYIGDRTNLINDANLKVFKEEWHHLVLAKHVADSIWADPRWPKATHAVMDPATFNGWDNIARAARGRMDPITDFVPLREATRRLLQKGADTFMNWIEMPEGYKFDRRIPNPYRNRISDIAVEFQSPRDFVAEGK